MWVYRGGGSSRNSGRVGLLGSFLLFLLVLLAQQVVIKHVDSPRHVVFTPMVSVLSDPFFVLFTVLWRLFFHTSSFFCSRQLCMFFLFFFLLALLLPFLFPLFAMVLRLGSSLSWPLSGLRAAVIVTIFLLSGDLAPPDSLSLEPVKLVLGGGHKGLVGDGHELSIEVVLVLPTDIGLEVVAGDHKVSLEEDANGVINGCAPGNQLEYFLPNLLRTLSMSPLTVAMYTPNNCRLPRRVCVVATELMVARCMMILYMRGAYSTPLKVYSFL